MMRASPRLLEEEKPLSLAQQLLAAAANNIDPDYEPPPEVGEIDVNELWHPISPENGIPSKQQQALDSEADVLLYGGAAGSGKLLDVDTQIPTPLGWTTMGDIQVGDDVFDENGCPTTVIAVSDIEYPRKTFKMTFDDGSVIFAGSDHQWFTRTDKERQAAFKRTEEYRTERKKHRAPRGRGLRPDLVLANKIRNHNYLPSLTGSVKTTEEIYQTLTVREGKRRNHAIPISKPLVLPEAWLPIPPYLLGLWVGDGSTKSGQYTAHIDDGFILDEWERYGYEVTRRRVGNKFECYIKSLNRHLRGLGVFGKKRIPSIYLRASEHQRLELLQGLMDSDGCIDGQGYASIDMSRLDLMLDIKELIESLGHKVSLRESTVKCQGKTFVRYRMGFTSNKEIVRLPRKKNRLRLLDENLRGTQKYRYVVMVEEEEYNRPMKCIQVEAKSHLYLCGSFIPTHNSDLLLGAAVTRHKRSIIFRREFTQLRELMDRSREVIGDNGRFNENLHLWRDLPGRGMIEFGGVKREETKANYKGRGHDLKGFDEITEFTESQFRFLIGWARTTIPGQRVRIICTCNPPTDDEGSWIIQYWAPWLDEEHPNPAAPGELRWFAVIDGKDVEVESGKSFVHGNETIKPHSRTFIPARLDDNPHLRDTGYRTVLQGLPEPLRSQLLSGDFGASSAPDPYQVIPTAWVKEAQKRWREGIHPDTPLTGVGVDCARGGKDKTCISLRYDNWFDEVIAYSGPETPDGPTAALKVYEALKDHPQDKRDQTWYINVDVIGVGSSVIDSLSPMYRWVTPIFAQARSYFRDKTKKMGMHNIRAEYYWRFREALDPSSDEDIALPPGNEILADLCAAKYKPTTRGILVEDKDGIKGRLGRSPNKGDAILMAHFPSSKSKFWARGPSR